MGRNRNVETDTLISIINEYHLNNPEIKIKYSDIGEFARNKGYKINDFNVRRDVRAKQHIDDINKSSDDDHYKRVVAYKTLDINAFILNNRTEQRLRKALSELDSYYASIASSAVKFKKEYEDLKELDRKQKAKINKLLDSLEEKKNDKTINKNTKEYIEYLEKYIRDTINPEIANVILSEKGVYEPTSTIVKSDFKNKIISHDTDISSFKSDALNKAIQEFKDEK